VQAADHVMEAVRAADHDRYLATLYAPEAKRASLFAIYAFNAEIAAVRDRIREPLPGEVRLQWWRDVLAGERAAEGHPVAEALSAAIRQHALPVTTFQNYLDARIFDLYDDPMPSRNDLEGYCGETASALIQLACVILDSDAAPRFADLAGHAGCAQAIAGLLRLLPIHRTRGQCYVPKDILAAAGASPAEFLAADGGAGTVRAVAAMTALGREHLQAFERGARALPRMLRPAFLPLALTGAYLEQIERSPAGALRKTAHLQGWRKHVSMLRRASSGWRSGSA
jgi:15-cis-phytoene synthase